MNGKESVKVKYLDTSSIVKLYIEEEKSIEFRKFFSTSSNLCTTNFTFYESLNVIKARLFKNESKHEYYKNIEKLVIHGWGGKIEIEEIDITNREVFLKTKDIATTYNLDLADAIQLYAILHGKYKMFCCGSDSVLVTGDKRQKDAAVSLGIKAWNITEDECPDWI